MFPPSPWPPLSPSLPLPPLSPAVSRAATKAIATFSSSSQVKKNKNKKQLQKATDTCSSSSQVKIVKKDKKKYKNTTTYKATATFWSSSLVEIRFFDLQCLYGVRVLEHWWFSLVV
jgi:hypothetical protein